jgi:hypothetical protein
MRAGLPDGISWHCTRRGMRAHNMTWTAIVALLGQLADSVWNNVVKDMSFEKALVLTGAVWGTVHAVRELFGFKWPAFRRHGLPRKIFNLAIALAILPFLSELLTFTVMAITHRNVAPHADYILFGLVFLACCYIVFDLWRRPTFRFANLFDQFALPFLPGGAFLGFKVAEHAAWWII